MRPEITVILPVYSQKEIVWLAMESLSRQDTTLSWELIVMEEEKGAAGIAFYESYLDRLKRAGMTQFRYYALSKRIGLVQKVIKMANLAEGKYLAKHDADNYHDSNWLEQVQDLKNMHADIWSSAMCYFYNLRNAEMYYLRNYGEGTKVAEIYRTELVRNTPIPEQAVNLDVTYFWKKNPDAKHITGEGVYLYTEGFNQVCKNRKNREEIYKQNRIREKAVLPLDILIPKEIAKQLEANV